MHANTSTEHPTHCSHFRSITFLFFYYCHFSIIGSAICPRPSSRSVVSWVGGASAPTRRESTAALVRAASHPPTALTTPAPAHISIERWRARISPLVFGWLAENSRLRSSKYTILNVYECKYAKTSFKYLKRTRILLLHLDIFMQICHFARAAFPRSLISSMARWAVCGVVFWGRGDGLRSYRCAQLLHWKRINLLDHLAFPVNCSLSSFAVFSILHCAPADVPAESGYFFQSSIDTMINVSRKYDQFYISRLRSRIFLRSPRPGSAGNAATIIVSAWMAQRWLCTSLQHFTVNRISLCAHHRSLQSCEAPTAPLNAAPAEFVSAR